MEIELLEVRDFLAEHPPFDALPDAALNALPKQLSIRYLRRGTPFPGPEEAGHYLCMVRQGALELRGTGGILLDKLGEGAIHAAPCLEQAQETELHGTAVEDTLLYLLPCSALTALRNEHPAFDDHFNRSVRERLRRALHNLQQNSGGGGSLMAVTAGELVARAPVTARPAITIRAAAEVMAREKVSSLLLMEGEQLQGIVTDRDLRSRCLAAGLDSGTRVADIMTRTLHPVELSTPAFEALLAMTRRNVHHLPVIDNGRVIGVLSTSDFIRHQSANTVYLAGEIARCSDLDALVAASRRIPESHLQLVRAGASWYQTGQAMATVTDAITRRLLQLAEAELGPPPVPYVWLACGSQARHEQTALTDQDNALLLDDSFAPKHADYFTALAERVNNGLADCGFPYCPGEVMAKTEQWRQPLRVWREYFHRWIDAPEPKALMHYSIFFDMRPVFGEERLCHELRAGVLRQARENGIFLAYLAANALHQRPPLGFFRHFVLIGDGEHENAFDIKRRGIIPVTDLARLFALTGGLPELNTTDRLQAAQEAELLSPESATELREAYAFIGTLRARHQAEQIARGEEPDNYLAPEQLSRLERHHLKEAFTVIRRLQDTLEQRYQAARFF